LYKAPSKAVLYREEGEEEAKGLGYTEATQPSIDISSPGLRQVVVLI
jgi:hypothetical protein